MVEIAGGVHRVDGLGDSRRSANVFLLVDESLTLVDAGPPGSHKAVARYVDSLGYGLQDVHQILITHAHPDHTGGVPALKRLTGARVYVHRDEMTRNARGTSLVSYGILGRVPIRVPLLEQVEADVILDDGDRLPIMGGLRTHHTPGHTDGSVCYQLENAGVLLSGDLFLVNGHSLQKNHAYPGSHRAAYQRSIERVASLDYQWLCPGHGAPVHVTRARFSPALLDPLGGYDWTWSIFAS